MQCPSCFAVVTATVEGRRAVVGETGPGNRWPCAVSGARTSEVGRGMVLVRGSHHPQEASGCRSGHSEAPSASFSKCHISFA